MTSAHTPLDLTLSQGVALYRHFDVRGELLYVGITSDPGRRWEQHLDTSPWAGGVARTYVHWYPYRQAARAAELVAIRTEQPLFNTARPSAKSAATARRRYIQTGISGLFRRVPCSAIASEFCISCGPDADAWLESLGAAA